MLKLKLLSQTGDTIIEVLIALAILASAFSIGYATANRGLQVARNADEHSEALSFIDSQLEMLRQAAPNFNVPNSDVFQQSPIFCLQPGTATTPPSLINFYNGYNHDDNVNNDILVSAATPGPSAPYPNGCVVNNLYYESIVYQPNVTGGVANDEFKFFIRWEGLGTLGNQQEELTYKIHQLAASPTFTGVATPLPPPPSQPINASFTYSMSGLNLSVDASSSSGTPPITSYTWDFGDGTAGSGVTASHSYTAAGNYNVTLTVNNGVSSASQTQSVTATSPPPITPKSDVTSVYYCNNFDAYGQPLQPQLKKLVDGNDNTGIVTSCSDQYSEYRVDLGSNFNISSVRVAWGAYNNNIQEWDIVTSGSNGGCDIGWQYTPPASTTTVPTSLFNCHGGSMQPVRYIYVLEYGQNWLSINEISATGQPAP